VTTVTNSETKITPATNREGRIECQVWNTGTVDITVRAANIVDGAPSMTVITDGTVLIPAGADRPFAFSEKVDLYAMSLGADVSVVLTEFV